MDKNTILFIISFITIGGVLITGFILYPQFVVQKQDVLQIQQDVIIKRIDDYNRNRTAQLIEIQNNLTNKIIQNQQLIKANQELIKNTTGTNLENTFINKANIEAIHNDTIAMMKLLNFTKATMEQNLLEHKVLDDERFKNHTINN